MGSWPGFGRLFLRLTTFLPSPKTAYKRHLGTFFIESKVVVGLDLRCLLEILPKVSDPVISLNTNSCIEESCKVFPREILPWRFCG